MKRNTKKTVMAAVLFFMLIMVCGCGRKGSTGTDDLNLSDASEAESQDGKKQDKNDNEPSTEAGPIVIKAESIELSGNAEETISIDKASYIESDRFIIYADPGVTLSQDAESFIKEAMSLLESTIGESYDNEIFKPEGREQGVTTEMKEGYDEAAAAMTAGEDFYGVDLEQEKMCIFVASDSKKTWCYNNGVLLRQEDLKGGGRRRAIDELAGLLCLRIGNTSLGDCLDGGLKGYYTQKLVNEHPELGISFDGHTYYDGVEKFFLTEKNGSNLICTSHGFEADSIGFRFMDFVSEKYNVDKIKEVYNSAAAYRELFMGTHSGAVTMQKVADLVKKATSPNVFVEFYEWYKVNAEHYGDMTYLEAETASSEAESETDSETGTGSEGESQTWYEEYESEYREEYTERDWQAFFEEMFGK